MWEPAGLENTVYRAVAGTLGAAPLTGSGGGEGEDADGGASRQCRHNLT